MATYKKAGVDISLGDICSKIMSSASDRTFAFRKGRCGEIKVIESKGLYRVITISFGTFRIMLNSDGIGTKVEIAERTGIHRTMAYDLFAMLCDDAVRYGAEPVAISNILDVNKLSLKVIKELSEGMVKAAKEAGVTVVSGEIAELGNRISGYGRYNYNWAGTVLSVLRKEMRPERIKKGQVVIALEEKGFRSNGISLVRKVLGEACGDNWHRKKINGRILGEMVLTPSRIYTPAVLDMLDFAEGITHITGGGIPEKLGRLLSVIGVGADITDLFTPPEVMLICQKLGRVNDKEAYKVWNMGQGMLIITDSPEKVVSIAKRYKIKAKIAGEITEKKGIRLVSKGYYRKGNVLFY
ncbi:MAG TPA: AIR synthase-related protein [bacterium]|nr:AIR synthase-related protein [bacterium]HPP30059.1 AIR synthase-related protein [bacterium]